MLFSPGRSLDSPFEQASQPHDRQGPQRQQAPRSADGLRLGFGRDVRATLTTPPLSLESVRRQLIERFEPALTARRGSAEVEESER